jgi:photosystem II stability/assembly factor-like uncharacterized protein
MISMKTHNPLRFAGIAMLGTLMAAFIALRANAQWVRLNSPISGKIVTVGDVLILTDDETMYRSTDSGHTWELVESMPSPVCTWTYLLAHGNHAYLTTGTCGFFASTDSGQIWVNFSDGLSYFFEDQPIAIGDTIYMDIPDAGIWETCDTQANWRSMKSRQPNCHFGGDTSVYCWGLDSNYLFAGATPFGGVYRSRDTAVTWDQVLPFSYDTGVFVITANGRYVVAMVALTHALHYIGLYRSTDWGTSWYPENNALNGHLIRALATFDNVMFAGGDFGVYTSTDNGETWFDANEDSTHGTIISFTSLGPYVYTSGGGNTWRRPLSDFNGGDVVSPMSSEPEASSTLEIYDLLGRRIFTGAPSSKPILASGFYFEREGGSVKKIWVP